MDATKNIYLKALKYASKNETFLFEALAEAIGLDGEQ